MLSAPLLLTLRRRLRRGQAERIAKCLAKVKGSSITFGELTRRTGVRNPEDKLQWMLGKGWLQNIALDVEHVCVRLLDETAQEDEATQTPPEVPETGNEALDRKSTRLNSSHESESRMPSSAWIRAHI